MKGVVRYLAAWEAEPGARIEEAAEAVRDIARDEQEVQLLIFNDSLIRVSPDTVSARDIVTAYRESRK